MPQSIKFDNLKLDGGSPADLHLSGYTSAEIDDQGKPGQVTLSIGGQLSETDDGMFETIVDLELAQAEAIAAALLALVDYVKRAGLE